MLHYLKKEHSLFNKEKRMYRSIALTLLSCATLYMIEAATKEIKDVAMYREIVKKQCPKVIVFSSVTCTACESHMQAIEEVSRAYPQAEFYKFDLTELGDLRKELGIKYYPTTHFLPSGPKIDRSMGAAELDDTVYELIHGKKKQAAVTSPQPGQHTAPQKRTWRKR